jgi:16S rRNA (guanine966-N2)-methyltransferase
MRIISGKYKGKKIIPPNGFNSRPTTDYAKESLFNILENRIDFKSVRVLDLFSGTGSISLEFLSRGCIELVAVEKNKRYTLHLIKQFELLFPEKTKVISTDVFSFCKKADLDYDIIFADPPFAEKKLKELPKIILENSSLYKNAFIIIEHPAEFDFKNFEYFTETRKYGHIHFSFFKKT